MDPASLKEALARACADLDAGRPLRRPPFALPTAALAVMGIALWSGCDGSGDTAGDDTAVLYAAPPAEDCDNLLDDDDDGLTDCDDDDCYGDPACDVATYRAP